MSDASYLRAAITRSKESAQQGRFPAGAAVVIDWHGKPVQYSGVSGSETDYRHAEVRVLEQVIEETGRKLAATTLYASMEPCLMCLTTAYWAGIRRVVYAIPKAKVKPEYYESNLVATDVNQQLLEPLELSHLEELEESALSVVREWESSKNLREDR